jgi:hypothetical protein
MQRSRDEVSSQLPKLASQYSVWTVSRYSLKAAKIICVLDCAGRAADSGDLGAQWSRCRH